MSPESEHISYLHELLKITTIKQKKQKIKTLKKTQKPPPNKQTNKQTNKQAKQIFTSATVTDNGKY